MEIADRVVVMSHGKIEQVGTPSEIYDSPANPFVCQFLGSVNAIEAQVAGRRLHHPAIKLDDLRIPAAARKPATVFVRPHDIELRPDAKSIAAVRFISTVGPIARIDVEADGLEQPLEVEIASHRLTALGLEPGTKVRLAALKGHIY